MSVLAALAMASLACCSCRPRAEQPLSPVTGRVLVNRQPAERALVVLHPVGDAAGPRPHGEVGPDGTFTLSTHGSNDGAPPGDYLVTVEWWLASGRRGDDSPPANRLPARYASPKTSGLTAHVGTGPTELRPFELTR
jgi:hypothetical protein